MGGYQGTSSFTLLHVYAYCYRIDGKYDVLNFKLVDNQNYVLWKYLPIKCFFFGGIGVWTLVFMLVKQVLYHLSHTSSPKCSCFYNMSSL
jgi:type VI protein secretion system component VasF